MSTPPQRRTPQRRRAARPGRPTACSRVRIHVRARATAVDAGRPRGRPWRAYAVTVAIVLSVAAGLPLYVDERSSRSHAQVVGATEPGQGTVTFNLFDGRVSDYPFDHYNAIIGFRASVGGRSVPLVIGLEEGDPFFSFRQAGKLSEGDGVAVNERTSRSRSTFILAWFMMAAMWALALAVLLAARLIVRQRRGIIWPALSWMAATLFALVGMRNAAPGNPPVGSLLDSAAFFWAELLVAVGLTTVAVRGARIEGGHGSRPG
ncbi:DUF4436 family protein [Kitasatospora sp. NPDC017646]|uniref:DUF4436 family protein n=1 Tax=Kitasatospora sp. NPDC017646 TaxID=3364024 RepID=UPI00378891DD